MSTTTTPAATAPAEAARWHQAHWDRLARDPALRDLPYRIETNARGQLILSPPPRNRHSFRQEAVQDVLRQHAPDGRQPAEWGIATPGGVKVPDVVWMSPSRREAMDATGDPTTLAPEICVEVMSPTNTRAEMMEKATLYLDAGAKEVWIVEEDGTLRVYVAGEDGAPTEIDASRLAPDAPARIRL
jgi:Uma2 family endonuclease